MLWDDSVCCLEFLRVNWQQLLQGFAVQPTAAQPLWVKLTQAYTQPDRHYHTLRHIQQVLQTVQWLQDEAENPAIAQLAAWFHDVVYNPRATDNEENSAAYAVDCLSQLQLPSWAIAATTRLILSTKHHRAALTDADMQVLLDADLAILGSEPSRYQHYAQAIRREYSWVPEDQYRLGRSRVLTAFLQRERLYYTSRMYQLAEAIARQNLQTELAGLKAI